MNIKEDIINSLVLSLKDTVEDEKMYALFVKEEYLPQGVGWVVLGKDNKGHELVLSAETILKNSPPTGENILDWASEICRIAVDKFESCRNNSIEWPALVCLEEKYGEAENREEQVSV